LIQGWYAGGRGTVDQDYLPTSWLGASRTDLDFYNKVYARSCRTCHVAFKESLNFDHASNLDAPDPDLLYESGFERIGITVCKGSYSWLRNYSMPNSLRTFNLLWASAGTAVDQIAVMANFMAARNLRDDNTCVLGPSP
jgi:hypothetical protein